jgi:hypothetical protein
MPGPTVVALRIAGPVDPWREAGFAVADDGRCRIGGVELRLGAPGDRGIVGWTLSGDHPDVAADVAGIPTEWSEPLPAGGEAHPNTAASVDHVVVRTPNASATFEALQTAGMVLRRERVAGEGERQIRQGFFRHGEAIVEVVGPEPPLAPGPSSLWGVTVTVADLDACAALLGPRLGAVHDAVQPGWRIATIDRAAGLGVPVAVMSA